MRNEAMPDLSLLFRSHASFSSFVEIANRQNEGGHAIQIYVRVVWAKENFVSSALGIDGLSICDKSSIFYLTQLVEWASLCPMTICLCCVQNTINVETMTTIFTHRYSTKYFRGYVHLCIFEHWCVLNWTRKTAFNICARAWIHFRAPYKVIIRVQQLVLLVLASIGWHHCRTQNSISLHNWSTVMWLAPIGGWRRVSLAINNHQGRTRNAIGPRNWSTVMWPVPIGWWHRVSPAIYTTLTQDLGFFVIGSLLIWTLWWAYHLVQAVRYTSGSSPCCEEPPVARARPTTFHSVYCLGVSPTSPRGLEHPVMCDTRVPCTENL